MSTHAVNAQDQVQPVIGSHAIPKARRPLLLVIRLLLIKLLENIALHGSARQGWLAPTCMYCLQNCRDVSP